MKRCPECRRDYYDDTLSFCLEDGTPLVYGVSAEEPATAILHATEPPSEAGTRDFDSSFIPGQSEKRNVNDREKRISRLGKRTWLFVGLFIVAIAGAFTAYRFVWRAPPMEHFRNLSLRRVTAEGAVESATISTDGKYIAYSLEESGRRSLWTKHLATESRVQIVPPVESMSLYASAFSPDGSYVYYTRVDDENPKGAVYVVPVLGGVSKKILADVSQPVSISPDGKQIVFGRFHLNSTDDQLFLANADGSDEHHLYTVSEPDYLTGAKAAWSPDGKMIALGYGSIAPGSDPSEHKWEMTVAVLSLADKILKRISTRGWPYIGNVAWFSDASGVAFVVHEHRTHSFQIWQCSVANGEARHITSDLSSYDLLSLTLTADSLALLAVQGDPVSQIWIAPVGDAGKARVITVRKNVQEGRNGLGWTPDGKLVFDSTVNTNESIWSINADGTDAKALTNGSADDFAPEVSPDGRNVFFGSLRNGFQIWRMDINGGNLRQMTNGDGAPTYSVSPDGRWVIYNPYLGGIYKIPADGGDPVEIIAGGGLVYPQVSPDGQLLAYFFTDNQTKRPKIAVVKFEGTGPVKTFQLPVSSSPSHFESLSYRGFHWSPDGSGLVYINTLGGVSNLWRQPLDGGPAKQITDFKSDLIYNFAYSRDGKTLAFARGSNTRDAVLITDVK